MIEHAEKMDQIYRYQRYIYDFTRKYFLLGRDTLLDRLSIQPHQRVLEMGCGTGRNLLKLSRRYSYTHFYGVDASQEMLNVAQSKLKSISHSQLILKQGLAEELNYAKTFNLEQPFDCIFFSYTLSMIPNWKQSIDAALQNLKAGGELYIVDFYDQSKLPCWFHKILNRWLDLFSVHYDPSWLPYFKSLELCGLGKLEYQGLFRNYTLLIKFTKTAS